MFNIFPNTYVIVALFVVAIYFHYIAYNWQRFEYAVADLRRINEVRNLVKRAKFMFWLFLVAAVIMAVLDLEASRYIFE